MSNENDRQRSIEEHYAEIGNMSVVVLEDLDLMLTSEFIDGLQAFAANSVFKITNSDLASREKGWLKLTLVSVPEGLDESYLQPGDFGSDYMIPAKFVTFVE